ENRGVATRYGGSHGQNAGGGRYQQSAPRYNNGGGNYGGGGRAPAYQSSPNYNRGNSGSYRSTPNAGSGYQPNQNSYGGRNTPSYRQQQQNPSPFYGGGRGSAPSTYQPP